MRGVPPQRVPRRAGGRHRLREYREERAAHRWTTARRGPARSGAGGSIAGIGADRCGVARGFSRAVAALSEPRYTTGSSVARATSSMNVHSTWSSLNWLARPVHGPPRTASSSASRLTPERLRRLATYRQQARRLFALGLDVVLVAIEPGERRDVRAATIGQHRARQPTSAAAMLIGRDRRGRDRAGSSGTRARRTSRPRASESTSARRAIVDSERPAAPTTRARRTRTAARARADPTRSDTRRRQSVRPDSGPTTT